MVLINSNDKSALNKTRQILICLCIIIATLAAFMPSLKNGYIWDDEQHVSENSLIRTSDGLGKIWFKPGAIRQYYPLTFTGFWIQYHLWGLNPFGYHLVNVLLHCLNAILLLYVIRLLGVPGAALVATIFALHPIQVETVAWISEQKNLLSGLFYLAALFCYLRFSLDKNRMGIPGGSSQKAASCYSKVFYILALGFFVCALLCKSVTCSLPAVVLLLLWWQHGTIKWHYIKSLLPMFLIGLILGINTIFMEIHNVGAEGSGWALPFIDRFLIAGRALWFYAGKIIWPYNLIFIYPKWQIDSTAWWQYLFPVSALIVVAVLYVLRQRIGKGPLVAVLFFAGTLFPALGFFNLYPFRYSYVADHFQYLACIGIITLIFSSLTNLINTYLNKSKTIFIILFFILSFFAALQTWKQTHIYYNLETLYKDIIAKNPDCWMAYHNLGGDYQLKGETQKALEYYLQAVKIKPDSITYYNIGTIYRLKGEYERGIEYYQKSIEINPNYANAYDGLGQSLKIQKKLDDAIKQFSRALYLDPENISAYLNIGTIYDEQGEPEKALSIYLQALNMNPQNDQILNDIGSIMLKQGKQNEAINYYTRALKTNPKNVITLTNIGNAYLLLGKTDEAIEYYLKSISQKPENKKLQEALHIQVAKIFAATGKNNEAHYHLSEAIRINQ
jgi:protein O-mannosyl-transferase